MCPEKSGRALFPDKGKIEELRKAMEGLFSYIDKNPDWAVVYRQDSDAEVLSVKERVDLLSFINN